MDQNEFFAQLPTGKEDKPLLFGTGPLTYDFHDVDGLYFMLDRKLSGCLILMWAKPMDPEVKGYITLDNKPVKNYVCQPMAMMQGMWILGVPLRGMITECGREYALHVEGFTDTDGNEMNPQDFTVKSPEREEPQEKHAAHEAVARQAATEGIVLLENKNHVLPLAEGSHINLFGKGIHQFRNGAVGAGKITPRYSVSLIEAIRESSCFTLNEELAQFYSCDEDEIPAQEVLERAKRLSDTAVMVISRASGENMDNSTARGEYYLSEKEERLLEKLGREFAHTIVILNVGYPIDVTFAERYGMEGLIYSGYGGMLGGPALLDILSGKENPSGKLTDTWARDYFDIPASKNFYDCVDKPRLDAECETYVDTVYEEDIYVGYRYFTTFGKRAAYPFGYGLSYTNFVIEPARIEYTGEELVCRVLVKNVGRISGKEVVQVYVGQPDGELEHPVKELAAYEKTKKLAPGELQELELRIPNRHMCCYSEKRAAYMMEKGVYRVYVGNSAEANYWDEFALEKERIIKQVKNRMVPTQEIDVLSKYSPEATFPKGEKSGVCEGKTTFEPYAERGNYPCKDLPDCGESRQPGADDEKPVSDSGEGNSAGRTGDVGGTSAGLTFADVRNHPERAAEFAAQLSLEELARLSVCASAGWGMEGVGEAGRVYDIGYGLPDFPVSDGNSGVNLRVPNIGMPSGATLGATFNKELCGQVGAVIGREAGKLHMPMILAPAFNIHRNPLNGRQPEYFSEDPYLSGTLAGYYSRGMEQAGTASCMKHLMANNCESTRKRNQSILTERTIREIYLRAFQIAMEVHMPASVMTAYNACNGCPTAADADLLMGMLREENGFDGFVMTDWTSYDTVDVAAMIQAGNCWMAPGSEDDTYTKPIVDGVKNGKIEIGRLRENVAAIIRTMARFV